MNDTTTTEDYGHLLVSEVKEYSSPLTIIITITTAEAS